jgi:plasmid maintenance system killer protein
MKVLESEKCRDFLIKRQLLDQYRKAKKNIETGKSASVRLKKRKPKILNTWYFRINKQYRAIAKKEGDILYVLKISDHQ